MAKNSAARNNSRALRALVPRDSRADGQLLALGFMLEQANGESVSPDRDSGNSRIIESIVFETSEITARQAALTLELRHAALDTYAALSGVRESFSSLRGVGGLRSQGSSSDNHSDRQGGGQVQSEGESQGPNSVLRLIVGAIIFVQDNLWLLLGLAASALFVVQLARR